MMGKMQIEIKKRLLWIMLPVLWVSCQSDSLRIEAPSELSFASHEIAIAFYTSGTTDIPTLDWGGETGTFSLSTESKGFSVDPVSGKVSWQSGIELGEHQLTVIAKNSMGQQTVNLTLLHSLSGIFRGGYNWNPSSNVLTDNDYELVFHTDGSMRVRDKLATGTGVWVLHVPNQLSVSYQYTGSNAAQLEAKVHITEGERPQITGLWTIPGRSLTGYFRVVLQP